MWFSPKRLKFTISFAGSGSQHSRVLASLIWNNVAYSTVEWLLIWDQIHESPPK